MVYQRDTSDPIATTIVAIKPKVVPNRANPRKVKAANPKAIERYTQRKKRRKSPSGLDAMGRSNVTQDQRVEGGVGLQVAMARHMVDGVGGDC
jgi:hypothetical protein